MGLLYPFPVSKDETDHVIEKDNTLILKSYGLPYIFWGYLLGLIILITFMMIGIYEPASKLLKTRDLINLILVYGMYITLFGTILGFLTLFFIEIRIKINGNEITKEIFVYWVKLLSRTYTVENEQSLFIENFEGSPNIAKMEKKPDMKTHQNKGYFELKLGTPKSFILLDRHSRKVDLIKLRDLISSHIKTSP